MKREIKSLTTRNRNLTEDNRKLRDYLEMILEAIKDFLKTILHIGNDKSKGLATEKIKCYYDRNDFKSNDVYFIARGTSKKNELLRYAGIVNNKYEYEQALKRLNKEGEESAEKFYEMFDEDEKDDLGMSL